MTYRHRMTRVAGNSSTPDGDPTGDPNVDSGMGPGSTRRQRERQARERSLLDLAQRILVDDGYLGLTMDRLAAEAGYAKGTLYLHFKNKEDLICALLYQFQERRLELFDRVQHLELPHRARLMGLGLAAEAFVLAYPENARIEPILKMSALRNKASVERREALETIETRCFERIFQEAEGAARTGEWPSPPPGAIEHLVLGLWSLHVGFNVLANLGTQGCPLATLNPALAPHTALFPVAQRLLDGYGFCPLSHEFDYVALRATLIRDLFQTEAGHLLRP